MSSLLKKLHREFSDDRAETSVISSNAVTTSCVGARPEILSLVDFVLSHCENDNRPYLQVEIFGLCVKGLLDSGATKTVIGQIGWDLIKTFNLPVLKASYKSIQTAGNNECVVLGTVNIPFRVMDKVVTISVLIVPEVSHALILGVAFLDSYGNRP